MSVRTTPALVAPTVSCPLFEVPIGREDCQRQSQKISTNEATCSGRGCPSPWRICLHCLRQGKTGPECAVTDPIHGTCKTHAGVTEISGEARFVTVPAARVRPLKGQPRTYFDARELSLLERSVLKYGQLQPGLVRKVKGDPKHDYELIDGQRRWHAAMKLGTPYKAIVIEVLDEEDQFEKSVASNFQRAEHTPMEIARAIDRLVRRGGRTQSDVATLVGRSIGWVGQYQRLLKLAPELQLHLEVSQADGHNPLPMSLAFQLAMLEIPEQLENFKMFQTGEMSTAESIFKIKEKLVSTGEIQHRKLEPRYEYRRLSGLADRTQREVKMLLSRLPPPAIQRAIQGRGPQVDKLIGVIDEGVKALIELRQRITAAQKEKVMKEAV